MIYPKTRIILFILSFCVSFLLLTVLWIPVEPLYGKFIAAISSEISALMMKATVKKIFLKGKEIKAIFTFPYLIYHKGQYQSVSTEVYLKISRFTFNVPLTFSLILSLFILVKWKKRTLLEAILILIAIHVSFVFLYFCLYTTYSMIKAGITTPNATKQTLLEFLWSFTDNMIIRFEPFLLSAYIVIRNSKNFLLWSSYNKRKR